MELGLSGLASGFDWRTFVDQMVDVQRAPQKRLRAEQNQIQQRNNAYTSIKTQLGVLTSRASALNASALFETRGVSVADEDVAKVTSTGGAPLGTFSLAITQMAAAAKHRGAANAGAALASSPDVSALVLGEAGFSTDITAGKFTVNGKSVTVATTDTLQEVFNKINTATGGAVTGAYDPATDKISLSGAGEIILGSATDTSNFLTAAKLANNGTADVTSGAALGGIHREGTLATANFSTAISDGGAGAGEFKINGVSISYSATADSVSNVLDRINSSGAGVTASYDNVNDRFVLTSKTTGDQGIALEDGTGNFLAASGLSAGTLDRGKNLLYEIDGGGQLSSSSNTITEESSGIAGLSIKAVATGTTEFTISSDTDAIKTAVKDFIAEYNKTQKLIDTNTASSTDANGKVTAGLLARDNDAAAIASSLRATVYSSISGFPDLLNHLSDLGIETNGNDDTLSLEDESKLDAMLATDLAGVRTLFTDESNGIAARLSVYLENTSGEEGSLVDRQSNLAEQITGIDNQVVELERLVQSQRAELLSRFVAMESAQAKSNQQLQFLQQRFK